MTISACCSPVVLYPLSPKPVLGMTLHRKSVQPVGSPRSPPTASRVWALTAWIKVTPHSHCAPCSPRAREPLPPLPPLHPLSPAVSPQGLVTPCYTLHHYDTHWLALQQICNQMNDALGTSLLKNIVF